MHAYHKIQTIYNRDPLNLKKVLYDPDKPEYSKEEFKALQYIDWEGTEKIDGTNIRVMFQGDQIKFAGRTEKADIPKHLLDRLNVLFPSSLMTDVPQLFEVGATLYGEGFGEKIQGNPYQHPVDFILFDVKINNIWLERQNVCNIAEALGIKVAPIVFTGGLEEATEYLMTNPKSTLGDTTMEGLILRPPIRLNDAKGNRIIGKLKCKDLETFREVKKVDMKTLEDGSEIQFICEFDDADSYEFNITRVIKSGKDFYFGQDSGCSCPCPFEDFKTLADYTLLTLHDFEAFEQAMNVHTRAKFYEINKFVQQVKGLLK